MKKTVLVMVLLVLLSAACRHDGDDFEPLPEGVHILGVPYDVEVRRFYYWSGGSRMNLDLPDDWVWVIDVSGMPIPQLTVSGGIVLVNYPGVCYWLDGVYHPLDRFTVNGLVESAEIIDGEVSIVRVDADYERVLFHDGVINSFTAKDGTVYSVGSYQRGKKVQACWWVDGVRYDLKGYGWATSIYVEE